MLSSLRFAIARLRHGMTLGVRILVRDETARVFLVRHSYVPGWHLPGGGVDVGETAAEAAVRELREEGNIEARDAPQLFGLYYNRAGHRRDHVALFTLGAWSQLAPPKPNIEIVEHGFYAPDALPAATTDGTRQRLREVLEGQSRSDYW